MTETSGLNLIGSHKLKCSDDDSLFFCLTIYFTKKNKNKVKIHITLHYYTYNNNTSEPEKS